MAKKDKPQLGDMVKDNITGFTGVMIDWKKVFLGSDICSIQPECKEGDKSNLPSSKSVLYERLELVEENNKRQIGFSK